MAKTYCLAIEVASAHIDNGLGYLVSFEAKDDTPPASHPDFKAWSTQLKNAVIRAGDQPFNPDPYTRKVAVAELMYEIEKLNSAYGFTIGTHGTTPAVHVQSTNPHDKRIHINFSDEDGQLDVVEKKSLLQDPARIAENGKVTVLNGHTRSFPFTPLRICGTKPPTPKAPGSHPHP